MAVKVLNTGGEVHIHKAGCKDLGRGENRLWVTMAETFLTLEEALEEFIDTGDEGAPGWMEDEIPIHRCAR